jgi:hypothetical protein
VIPAVVVDDDFRHDYFAPGDGPSLCRGKKERVVVVRVVSPGPVSGPRAVSVPWAVAWNGRLVKGTSD